MSTVSQETKRGRKKKRFLENSKAQQLVGHRISHIMYFKSWWIELGPRVRILKLPDF